MVANENGPISRRVASGPTRLLLPGFDPEKPSKCPLQIFWKTGFP